MDPSTWYWADYDGTLNHASLAELRGAIDSSRLPAFVLVWRSGWAEWVPAYLVGAVLEDPDAPPVSARGAEQDGPTEPPEPPLEWYVECLGSQPTRSLVADRAARATGPRLVLDLDLSDSFSPHELPTTTDERRLLPLAAFPRLDDYLAYVRRQRERERSRRR